MTSNGREFTLKHEFDFEDVSKSGGGEQLDSPEEEHFGVNWKISIQKDNDDLSIYLLANEIKNQEIQVDYTVKIFSKNKEKTHSKSVSENFRKDLVSWYWFTNMDTVEKEYLNDGKLKVEIHAKINNIIRIPRKVLRSFGEEMKQFSDVVLVAEGRKFYVLKLYLACQSPYFANLFLGQSGKTEIGLNNVNPEDLQCFLEVIYAEDAINEDTVEEILQIADMFSTPLATKKCEKFLIGTSFSQVSQKKQLKLAEKYKLEELKKICQMSV
ncbi:hypothetical protein B9Z55_007823 [Caenorhabditis nigoni]|uniref:BTB domain-containing protein n=1 Tax=Caenorhabditis nigoni TaxID=1611254 RepID=A0A2G5VBK1_9PELO|nr:hypothetical protein B9Z55_007823 [Caenorhabditis nigoni]